MNFRKGQRRDEPEINLIAFIDVLLVILIFLMVTTTYSKITALQVTLPAADAEKARNHATEIHVAVNAQGRYAVDNLQVAARDAVGLGEELQAVLRRAGKGQDSPVVIVNADASASHQSVVTVLEAARLAGMERVTFAAQTRTGK